MKEIAVYLMEFFLISTLFFVVYVYVKGRSIPSLKRVLLLCWLVSSFLFPLITIDGYVYSVPQLTYENLETNGVGDQSDASLPKLNTVASPEFNSQAVVPTETVAEPSNEKVSYKMLLITVYLVVASLLLVRFFMGLVQIMLMKRHAEKRHINGRLVFMVNQPGFTGASFFKWVFIGADIASENLDLVLQHEIIHSRLWHSLDVMLGNLYQIIFWFNPLSWYLLRQIKINTELETDLYLSKEVSIKKYGDLLLNLHQTRVSYVMNSFSSSHLKIRIKAMTHENSQRKWVLVLPFLSVLISFVAVSCGDLIENQESLNTELAVDQRLNDVKSITSKFISHQKDTHQKTGKIVSKVTFHPDGSLKAFVNQTSYPYDRDYEAKRTFWDEPIKRNLFHVMDGLSLDVAERNILYGNDWSSAYLKYLRQDRKGELQSRFWKEHITADREEKPTAITIEKEYEKGPFSRVNVPITTEFFKYDGDKVIETSYMNEYKIDEEEVANFVSEHEEARDFIKQQMARVRKESGIVHEGIKYIYDGDLLTSITFKDQSGSQASYKFFYEKNLLTKQEYYKYGKLINSRVFYYKNGLKDRSEIFNVYNEPEYTIQYEYEFW